MAIQRWDPYKQHVNLKLLECVMPKKYKWIKTVLCAGTVRNKCLK